MNMLRLEEITHQRGVDGELLPLEVELEVLREYVVKQVKGKKKEVVKKEGPIVKITPMTRGEIKALSAGLVKKRKEGKEIFETTEDQDGEIIRKHLIEPKVSEEDIKYLKPKYASAIATAIMAVSLNVDQKTMQEAGKAAVQKYADRLDGDLKKN